jgi:hypothetical protein
MCALACSKSEKLQGSLHSNDHNGELFLRQKMPCSQVYRRSYYKLSSKVDNDSLGVGEYVTHQTDIMPREEPRLICVCNVR